MYVRNRSTSIATHTSRSAVCPRLPCQSRLLPCQHTTQPALPESVFFWLLLTTFDPTLKQTLWGAAGRGRDGCVALQAKNIQMQRRVQQLASAMHALNDAIARHSNGAAASASASAAAAAAHTAAGTGAATTARALSGFD